MNTVSLFLFGAAYKTFWKTILGSVIGVLNPGVLESKDKIDQATLSVDNPQKIMIFGKSKDMGKCKSVKKNGEPCSSIVNLSRCEYCIYHVKQEYKKCSRRAELQSVNPGQRFSTDNFNKKKPLQSSRIFNQDTQPYTPVLAKKNEKLYQKDQARLALLSGSNKCGDSTKKAPMKDTTNDKTESKVKGFSVELTTNQTKKDFERLNKLRGWRSNAQVMVEPSQKSIDTPASQTQSKVSTPISNGTNGTKTVNKNFSLDNLPSLSSVPRLGIGCVNGQIDISEAIPKRHINKAKMDAIKWVQQNGGIKPSNPNKIHASKEAIVKAQKRQREEDDCKERTAKKPTELSARFKELLEAKSSHTDLIEKSYEEEKEKYFNKLEMKERMEEKMLTTYEIECKAVKCLTCKYTAFSASDICKEKNHPLRLLKAMKRFFKCSDCGNRTVSLDRMPSHSCVKCSGSKWMRAAMMDEKKTAIPGATLSVRGDEETFIGSLINGANLNLLVPEAD